MKLAYLVNQYPKVSHSFIRREILGVEACGIPIARFSIRDLKDELVDEADQQEFKQTRYLLNAGGGGLLSSLLQVALTKPLRFLKALQLAIKVGLTSDRGLIFHLIYLVEACLLLKWLQADKIDHIHVHFGTNSATVAMLCHELGGPPYSLTIHGPEEFDRNNAIALTEKLHRAAFVVGVSSFGKSQLFRWCDLSHWSKIHVIHCGVDQMFLEHPFVPVPEHPKFVCVGRLGEQKGHLVLLEAARQLAAEGCQFRLVLVGDGPLRSQIEAFIAQHRLQDAIAITGWATNTEVQQEILDSRAMVLPSFAEGLPVVIMEALALARPVISTYVAGIPELVEPGVCGWLVPAASVDALADAMRAALEASSEQLATLGKMGAERVAKQHNITTEAGKLAELFQRYCS